MQKKKIAMLMSAVMILSGTAMPSEMTYAMDDIQVTAEETDEADSSEEAEPEDQETDVEEDADDFGDDSSDEEVSVEPQDGENESEDEVNVFSDEENAAVGEDEKGEIIESGSCGNDATYKLYADGTLYIEGTGAIEYHCFDNNDNIKSLIIGEGITSISSFLFQGNKNLVSVTLPEGFTDLENYAFESCSNLTTINLPESLTNIGWGTFGGCSSLANIKLPESLKSIGHHAFRGCSSLTSINLPEGLTDIGDEAFSGCTSLSEITWPTNITRIEAETFSGCSNLTSFDFSNITSIGNSAFSGCGFKTIVIPENVTEIGNNVFKDCSNLRSVKLPSELEKISDGMFNNCSRLSDIEIPDSVKEIGASAFESGWDLTDIKLPDGLVSIGDSAFSSTEITYFRLPESLQSIGNYAFASGKFSNIEIPKSVTKIGNGAFAWSNLREITVPESAIDFGYSVFSNCAKLEKVVIKSNITELKKDTFKWCYSLKDITLPESLTKIGKNVFNSCSKIKSINLPDNLKEIDEYAFQSCGIDSIKLPQNMISIGYGTFYNCTNLTNISLPEKLQTVDTDAFKNCSNLRSVYIPGADVELATRAIGYKDDNTKCDNIVLIGKAGSTTEAYATKNSFTFHNVADKLIHVSAVAATCLAKGNVEYWHCDTCNTNFSNEEGTVALDQTETDIIAHDLAEVESKYPTCTETGISYHWHCNSCGKNFRYSDGTGEIENVVIPARGHNMYFQEGCQATCYGEGRKDCYYCGNCEKYFLDEKGTQEVTEEELVIPRNNNHNLIFYQGRQATCSDEGRKDWYLCSNCGKYFLDKEGTQEVTEEELVIPKNNNHDLRLCQGHKATCYGEGRKDYYQCAMCGKIFLDEKGTQEVTDPDKELRVPKTDHKWIEVTETGGGTSYGIPDDGKTYPIKKYQVIYKEVRCKFCGLRQSHDQITYALIVNAHKATLKYGQSTTGIKVTEMNSSDYLKSVTSKNTSIVKVSDVSKKGTFKLTAGKKSGKTLVHIELASGLAADVHITVQSGTVKTNYITGLKKSVNVSKGKTYTLKPTLDPITSQEKVTYSSSNTKVATVSSKGVITGKAAGTAKITVKSGSKKVTVTVKVTKVKTKKLSGVPSSKTVKKGKTFTIKASVTPKNSDEKVIYKTSNKKIATVTSKGVVKGIKKGTATVTVQSGSKKQTCKVTVK